MYGYLKNLLITNNLHTYFIRLITQMFMLINEFKENLNKWDRDKNMTKSTLEIKLYSNT